MVEMQYAACNVVASDGVPSGYFYTVLVNSEFEAHKCLESFRAFFKEKGVEADTDRCWRFYRDLDHLKSDLVYVRRHKGHGTYLILNKPEGRPCRKWKGVIVGDRYDPIIDEMSTW